MVHVAINVVRSPVLHVAGRSFVVYMLYRETPVPVTRCQFTKHTRSRAIYENKFPCRGKTE